MHLDELVGEARIQRLQYGIKRDRMLIDSLRRLSPSFPEDIASYDAEKRNAEVTAHDQRMYQAKISLALWQNDLRREELKLQFPHIDFGPPSFGMWGYQKNLSKLSYEWALSQQKG